MAWLIWKLIYFLLNPMTTVSVLTSCPIWSTLAGKTPDKSPEIHLKVNNFEPYPNLASLCWACHFPLPFNGGIRKTKKVGDSQALKCWSVVLVSAWSFGSQILGVSTNTFFIIFLVWESKCTNFSTNRFWMILKIFGPGSLHSIRSRF